MNPKPQMSISDQAATDSAPTAEDATQDKTLSKKAALQQKCGDILKSLASFQKVYDGILAALAASHEQAVQALRDELQELKDAIPDLEKK